MTKPESAPPAVPVIAVIGNPNTGKSTLFNRLTGLRQRVGNYPGVTVEKHIGSVDLLGTVAHLVDLPGTYSLAAHSPDEMVAVDVLLNRQPDAPKIDAVLIVVDAANLRRNLFLASQVLELGLPTVIALNMIDEATSRGIAINAKLLGEQVGAWVVPTTATTGVGLTELRAALRHAVSQPKQARPSVFPELTAAATEFAQTKRALGIELQPYEVERGLVDVGAYAEERLIQRGGVGVPSELKAIRDRLAPGRVLAAEEARRRYAWIAERLVGVETRHAAKPTWTDRLDALVTHPILGFAVFIGLMALVFQAVFSWAVPLMDAVDAGRGWVAASIGGWLPPGAIRDLVCDGLIAGVGNVVIFLPQIIILFFFISLLEDSGYMARAAFMMDRLMRWAGLSGQSFIPLLSSFACAVPGIMATRVIPARRDRLTTILVAPLMSCSARLPVYVLLIAACVPATPLIGGLFTLQGLTMLGLYVLGMVIAVMAAFLIKRTMLKGPTPPFLMELPTYKWPTPRMVLWRVLERGWVFVRRAGTVIFMVTVVVWALSYFPRPAEVAVPFDAERQATEQAQPEGKERDDALADIDRREATAYFNQSALAQLGRVIEPVFWPLGWDWRVSAAVLASFPAREVVVGTLGVIFAQGPDIDLDDDDQREQMRQSVLAATWPDGRPVFTAPMAVGLMVFFALCLQCTSTLAAIRRETNSWGWAVFAWTYMTVLAYLGALATYQLGLALGG